MKPDRIQLAPGDGQGPVFQIVTTYKVVSLNQAAILAGVFSDLADPSLHQAAMTVERHLLTVYVAPAAGGPLTGAQLALIEAFDSIYAMVIQDLAEEDEEDVEDDIDY